MAIKKIKILFGFSKKAIQDNRQSILYVIGQLQAVHNKENNITIGKTAITYVNNYWTKDPQCISKLLHLAASPSINAITPFNAQQNAAKFNFEIEPTLSPKDPKFPKWRSDYESRMKAKPDGQEPFDD